MMTLPDGTVAINLGCGLSIAPGWINIDNSPNARLAQYPLFRWLLWKSKVLSDNHYRVQWPKTIKIHDLKKKLPFAASSVDYVYTSHTMEHMTVGDAQKLAKEIYRVLKKGGVVRIVVPDLSIGVHRYLEALRTDSSAATAAPEFLRWMQLADPTHRDPHLWMYDAPSLKAMLIHAGFTNVEVCNYRQGRVPDCNVLDNRPDESLHMEAEK